MNLSLGNLIGLKRHLLAASLQAQTDYDTLITEIGRGVAAQFDKHCNRRFERIVGEKDIVTADRDHVYLTRFPFETITTVEQRDTVTDGWRALTGAIQNQDEASGYVYFGAQLGIHTSRLRITYTGGYWFDTTEDGTGSLPAGATQLPHDMTLAWKLQCAHVWDMKDKLGLSVTTQPQKFNALAEASLIPEAELIIRKYIRYAIT